MYSDKKSILGLVSIVFLFIAAIALSFFAVSAASETEGLDPVVAEEAATEESVDTEEGVVEDSVDTEETVTEDPVAGLLSFF